MAYLHRSSKIASWSSAEISGLEKKDIRFGMLESNGELDRHTMRRQNMGYRVDTKVFSFPSCQLRAGVLDRACPQLESVVLATAMRPGSAVKRHVLMLQWFLPGSSDALKAWYGHSLANKGVEV